ncbi:MAG: hypothetical protein ACK5QH_16075 [Rubrivivax sp.]
MDTPHNLPATRRPPVTFAAMLVRAQRRFAAADKMPADGHTRQPVRRSGPERGWQIQPRESVAGA